MIEVASWLQATLNDVEREALKAQEVSPAPWTVAGVHGLPSQPGTAYIEILATERNWDGAQVPQSLWDVSGNVTVPAPVAVHVAGWDPVAVLASVEADRAILAEHHPEEHWAVWSDSEDDGGSEREGCMVCTLGPSCPHPPAQEDVIYPCRTVLLVASRYAHRPGWRPEWACA